MKTLFASLLLMMSVSLFAQHKTVVENVNAETFKKYIDENKGVLIDLRTEDEIKEKGKIKGAEQIDFLSKSAEEEINRLDKSKTYLIYCAGGGRSSDCADFMSKNGFKHVVNLQKGFDEWKKKGYETVKPNLKTKY